MENEEGNKEISLREAVDYIETLLDSLAEFHNRGRLHLGITPETVLIRDGKMILKEPDEIPDASLAVCRKYKEYAAPEQRLKNFQKIGYASDLYSVCAVFYQMLTGQEPKDEKIFGKTDRMGLTPELQIFQGKPIETFAQTVKIVKKGMYPLSDKRYQSVDELKRVLEMLEK